MTHCATHNLALRVRALKLLQLARRGVLGERANAARLLLTHLQTHNLTPFNIDLRLPVTQDLSVPDAPREAQLKLARLGTDGQDQALGMLVDDPTLTPANFGRVLAVMDLDLLARTRAQAWAHLDGLDRGAHHTATHHITPQDLKVFPSSMARRTHAALRQASGRSPVLCATCGFQTR